MSEKIAVIDYGLGNLHSAHKALVQAAMELDSKKHFDIQITHDPKIIAAANRVVFPGVGAPRDCMAGLESLDLIDALSEAAQNKPLLAICIAMQALMEHSTENGGIDCLGWIKGRVKRFEPHTQPDHTLKVKRLKVPHMGWNQVHQLQNHPMWRGIDQDAFFYFVHSYYVEPKDINASVGHCHYGHDFCAALSQNNVFATQFHPEKSHKAGLKLLQNFLTWNGSDTSPC